jgi:hypothetical protein
MGSNPLGISANIPQLAQASACAYYHVSIRLP